MGSSRRLLLAGAAALLVGAPGAQAVPGSSRRVSLHVDSGWVFHPRTVAAAEGLPAVVFERLVSVPGAAWLRLEYGAVVLSGTADRGGDGSFLRITSLQDGHAQTQHAVHVGQWRDTSAYFNGDAVLLEILAHPGTGRNRIRLDAVVAGVAPATDSICGPTDDRVLSNDRRAGRNQPAGCTSWILDDCSHCLLTAGHCASGLQVVQFNVPLSSASGSIRHPPPSDQYALDPVSLQGNGGMGYGNDWTYFGLFPNSNTGMTAWEAQGRVAFRLASSPPAARGQSLRVTGYGSVTSPVSPTWHLVQKTHAGPYVNLFGTALSYATDTTTGNSGSPVIDESTGDAIGIHAHAGCKVGGGENYGTASNHPGLQAALANPRGVCVCPPAQYSTFGQGCAGGAGTPALQPQSLPALGSTFVLDMTNLPAGSVAFMALGFSNTVWNGTPLPAGLAQFGLPGCTGYISVDHGESIPVVVGTATWSLVIPNDSALQGLRFFNQGLSLQVSGVALSDAGAGTIF